MGMKTKMGLHYHAFNAEISNGIENENSFWWDTILS